MFPGMSTGPDDLNRGSRRAAADADTGPVTWPGSLRWSHHLIVAAAVLMILTGMVGLTQDRVADPGVSREVVDAFHRNVRFISVYNILAALLLAACSAQLRGGGMISRRILAGVIALSVFFNIAAFAIQVGGVAMVAVCVVLGVALVLLFRPGSTSYMQRIRGSGD